MEDIGITREHSSWFEWRKGANRDVDGGGCAGVGADREPLATHRFARMIDIDRSLPIPVIELDLGPFSVTEPMLDAIAVDLQDVLASIEPPQVIIDLGPTHHLGSKAISVLVR